MSEPTPIVEPTPTKLFIASLIRRGIFVLGVWLATKISDKETLDAIIGGASALALFAFDLLWSHREKVMLKNLQPDEKK